MEHIKSLGEFFDDNTFKFEFSEDYSNELKTTYSSVFKCNVKEYVNCKNFNIIVEGSFNRLLEHLKNKDFAIITAYRNGFSKQDNILRNRKLRSIFNENKMGVHQLVGHWLEAPEGKDYRTCDKSELTDVIERSYLVSKPDDMSFGEFKEFIFECMTIDGVTQDCCVIHEKNGVYYQLTNNNELVEIGKNITFDKIAQAYSEYKVNKKSKNKTFIFEGVESPGSNSGRWMFREHNLLYFN